MIFLSASLPSLLSPLSSQEGNLELDLMLGYVISTTSLYHHHPSQGWHSTSVQIGLFFPDKHIFMKCLNSFSFDIHFLLRLFLGCSFRLFDFHSLVLTLLLSLPDA